MRERSKRLFGQGARVRQGWLPFAADMRLDVGIRTHLPPAQFGRPHCCGTIRQNRPGLLVLEKNVRKLSSSNLRPAQRLEHHCRYGRPVVLQRAGRILRQNKGEWHGYCFTREAKLDYEPGAQQRHSTRIACTTIGSFLGISLPFTCRFPPWATGPRIPRPSSGRVRSWMFLAPTSLYECPVANHQSRILASEVTEKRGT